MFHYFNCMSVPASPVIRRTTKQQTSCTPTNINATPIRRLPSYSTVLSDSNYSVSTSSESADLSDCDYSVDSIHISQLSIIDDSDFLSDNRMQHLPIHSTPVKFCQHDRKPAAVTLTLSFDAVPPMVVDSVEKPSPETTAAANSSKLDITSPSALK